MWVMGQLLGPGFLASPTRSFAWGVGLACTGGGLRLVLRARVCGVSVETPSRLSPLMRHRVVMPASRALSPSSRRPGFVSGLHGGVEPEEILREREVVLERLAADARRPC